MGFEPFDYKKKVSAFNTQYSNTPALHHSPSSGIFDGPRFFTIYCQMNTVPFCVKHLHKFGFKFLFLERVLKSRPRKYWDIPSKP